MSVKIQKPMTKHMVDLFAGFGGASEAMLGHWELLRFDNNPLLANVPRMIVQDIKTIKHTLIAHRNPMKKIDLIWASPPCREFSNAYGSPKSIYGREHGLESYEPDMSLLEAAMEIIEIAKPKYWVIENVVGSIRYFAEYLGEPRQIIGPYVLWGNFPFLDVDKTDLESKKSKDVHSSNPLRSNYKAKVDYSISLALKNAIENQKSILEF